MGQTAIVTTWYLDTDAEITDAVARLRSATGDRVVLVLPPGSRIATGRINFRLLAREAASRDIHLAVASPDEQVRSMAVSAGVLARSTADEAEAALIRGDAVPEPVEPSPSSPTLVEATGTGTAAISGRTRRRRVTLTASSALILGVAGIIVGLRVLPTASITITPHSRPVGPLAVAVTAGTSVGQVDADAGLVPAELLPVSLSLDGTFPATGSDPVETRAVGEVVFTWRPGSSGAGDLEGGLTIDAPTRVFTAEGLEFRTTRPVFLPTPADPAAPVEGRAPVEAARSGPDGNVPAGAISIVPSLEGQGVSVTNPDPTSGGRREDSPVITQEDWQAAAIDLRNRLAGELAARVRDPALAPTGRAVYPETARLGEVVTAPSEEDLVGQAVAEFSLRGSATGEVLAVDERLVEQVAAMRLASQVPAGMKLDPATLRTDPGVGSVRGDEVSYAAVAHGDAYPLIDAATLLAEVRGLPISEARAILQRYGSADVSVWPDFVGNLPEDQGRISLAVEAPSADRGSSNAE